MYEYKPKIHTYRNINIQNLTTTYCTLKGRTLQAITATISLMLIYTQLNSIRFYKYKGEYCNFFVMIHFEHKKKSKGKLHGVLAVVFLGPYSASDTSSSEEEAWISFIGDEKPLLSLELFLPSSWVENPFFTPAVDEVEGRALLLVFPAWSLRLAAE